MRNRGDGYDKTCPRIASPVVPACIGDVQGGAFESSFSWQNFVGNIGLTSSVANITLCCSSVVVQECSELQALIFFSRTSNEFCASVLKILMHLIENLTIVSFLGKFLSFVL